MVSKKVKLGIFTCFKKIVVGLGRKKENEEGGKKMKRNERMK